MEKGTLLFINQNSLIKKEKKKNRIGQSIDNQKKPTEKKTTKGILNNYEDYTKRTRFEEERCFFCVCVLLYFFVLDVINKRQ